MNESTARHRAPDVGFSPLRDPRYLRVLWIAAHDLKHLPERIASHRAEATR